MAALTATVQDIGSLGSYRLNVYNVTPTSANSTDTLSLGVGAPVVAFWGQNNNGTQGTDPDIQWSSTTGNITFTNGSSVGSIFLFVLMRT